MSELYKAVFFDRDGVINKERADYVKNVNELEINPNVAKYIRKLKNGGFLIIVITNQSAVNRGLTTHEDIKEIHLEIQKYMNQHGTTIDSFYYCPHRPTENCECRKPKPGMILKASKDFKIDLSSSWLLGDSDSDIKAAKQAGCKYTKINSTLALDEVVQKILAT